MSTVRKSRPPTMKNRAMDRMASRAEPVTCRTKAKAKGPQIELNLEKTE
jgi:hypothetical protein